ncbi:uncharacterized protein LOC107980697 [Nasonia vitripennis]|uniref:Uncharacterized protein n=2 Tax=Pteromalinae TaxID=272242 RepID=A0A7M7IV27_NASVI|nr:uncharacterized protein LOC107980697 [Nasonia vitripennis]OXU30177.1 hypothetical protein TSAR_007630 [Trichomalopsis sarcophagae]
MTSGTFTNTFLRLFTVTAYCASLVLAGPRYIAIPIDGVDVIELNPIGPPPSVPLSPGPRYPRQAEGYMPVAVSSLHHAPEPMIEQTIQLQPARPERSVSAHTAHILDYVDFGAHTGPNGAFSWYADYPSHH